jgi:RNA polymerase sigma-70 factor (ECF subfamily)
MSDTRKSLLIRAQTGNADAWQDLIALYRPLIVGWLRRQGVRPDQVDDLAQDILLTVVKHLPSFSHSGHRGAFRSWLRTIARNCLIDFWNRSKARGRTAAGEGGAEGEALRQLEDPDSELNRQWDEEHDRYVLRCLLDLMELEFEPSTVRAFRRVTLEGASAAEAGEELGLSVGAVYAAKSRVLGRLRQAAEGLIEEFP